MKSAITGEAYIPKRRKKEREVNDYIDKLKYVKNKKLYNKYRELAIRKEHIDPAKIIYKNKADGDNRKRGIAKLENIKRRLKTDTISFKDAKKAANYDKSLDSKDDLVKELNKEINFLRNSKKVQNISPMAAKAIMYYNESENTAQAFDKGDALETILSALNRKEREYFQPFLNAPEEERHEIVKLVPKYMRRPLQAAYGMKVDKKDDLNEYFKNHALPEDKWAGWNEDVNLEDVKVKIIKREGLDMGEFDKWQQDEDRAEYLNIPIPKINYHEKGREIQERLRKVLSEVGLSSVDVSYSVTNNGGIDMNVDIENDRRDELSSYVDNYGIY